MIVNHPRPNGGLVEPPNGGLVEPPNGGLVEPPNGGLVEQQLKNKDECSLLQNPSRNKFFLTNWDKAIC